MAPQSLSIASRLVGDSSPPFVIAEMSGNHNHSLDRALALVDAAADSGAHAIKLQTYTADSLTLNISGGDFQVNDPSSLWSGSNLHDLYSKAYTPWEWHHSIFAHAHERGLICFSSPFDEAAVDFLETLDVPAYKIASFENNYLSLISKAASTGKPLIISTGMASLADLERAVDVARNNGCKDLVLLKCTSTYPASPVNTNIRTIPHLAELFDCQVGLSDHSMGVGVAVASVALGATVIEKHLTISRAEGGVDSAFSLEPHEFKLLVDESLSAWQSLGTIKYGPTLSEQKSLVFRRSIYVSSDIHKGEAFSHKNIRVVRPGYGAPPYLFDQLIGKFARQSYKAGTPLSLDQLL